MPDLAHQYGGDLQLSPTGGLALASGDTMVAQRIYRRLMTNPLDYDFEPTFGAGLPQYVGQPAAPATYAALVRQQLALESSVASGPEPTVAATSSPDGTVTLTITYTDAATGQSQTLTLPTG